MRARGAEAVGDRLPGGRLEAVGDRPSAAAYGCLRAPGRPSGTRTAAAAHSPRPRQLALSSQLGLLSSGRLWRAAAVQTGCLRLSVALPARDGARSRDGGVIGARERSVRGVLRVRRGWRSDSWSVLSAGSDARGCLARGSLDRLSSARGPETGCLERFCVRREHRSYHGSRLAACQTARVRHLARVHSVLFTLTPRRLFDVPHDVAQISYGGRIET